MEQLAEDFINRFNLQGHTLGLIKRADLRVKISCDSGTFILEIKNSQIVLKNHHQQNCYQIAGDYHTLKQLFEGTERLRILERKGQLTIEAPLRTILLLESIFFLTKAHENLAKVI
ncbi:hypothetical protein [Bacillus sp. USDA818B3_A]|uniref:hypothetical protein n=1 Tax=Bacillus sp. USDA818B3_A TaxID=2698834 RepID=UPI00136C0224|nr:hypothetical protein [Bacillus sp. USDA818B3_A]